MNSAYVIYGVRIPDMDWQDLEDSVGQWDTRGKVGYFQGGLHDRELTFLVTYRDDVPCGQYYIITAERIHAERKWRRAWDDNLVTVSRDLGVTIIDGPGWYFVPSEDR
jgi:hypothetical protein